MPILKPDGSVVVAIATGILVYAIHDRALPDMATIHQTGALDGNIDAARKKAVWAEAGAVALVTLLTKDVNPLVIGGFMIFALDWHTRHANASDNETGNLVSPAPGYRQPRQEM